MPAPGAKPKDQKHGHTPTVHEWTEVPDVPFRRKKPVTLPTSRPFIDKLGLVHDVRLCARTKAWWKTISSMPHCVLWTPADWEFALATAIVADMLFQGDRQAAGELRIREKVLGTTLDARRDLRIRHVKPEKAPSNASSSSKGTATVTSLADRRAKLTGAT